MYSGLVLCIYCYNLTISAAGQLNPDGVTQLFEATGDYETKFEPQGLGGDSVRWDLLTTTLDFEMTGYFSNAPASDTVSAKIRGGAHCEPEPCYTGCCYILQAPTTGGGGTIETECPHQNGAGYNQVTDLERKCNAQLDIRVQHIGERKIPRNT